MTLEDNAFMSGEFSWGMLLAHLPVWRYAGRWRPLSFRRCRDRPGVWPGWGRSLLTSRRPPASCHTSAARRVTAIALTTASVSIPPAVSLRFASYRYSDPQFLSYARYLDYDDGDRQSEKQTLSVTASQYISALSLNLYVNMLRQTWWNDSPSTTGSITAGYNFDMGRWKNLGVTPVLE